MSGVAASAFRDKHRGLIPTGENIEMVDKISPEQRSENMRRVRSEDTGPEIRVRKVLHRAGYRFRLHRSDLPGKPDIVLAKYKTALFVHGCFWHGHSCPRGTRPTSNADFWAQKITRNIERDRENVHALIKEGWKVVVLWECQLRKMNDFDIVQRIREVTSSG